MDEFLVYISRPWYAESDNSIQLFDNKIIDFINKSNVWVNLVIVIITSSILIIETISRIKHK